MVDFTNDAEYRNNLMNLITGLSIRMQADYVQGLAILAGTNAVKVYIVEPLKILVSI